MARLMTMALLSNSPLGASSLVNPSVAAGKKTSPKRDLSRLRGESSALEYLKWSGASLKFCSDEIRRDRDAVLTAVAERGANFQYAHESLKGNRSFVFEAFAAASYDPEVIKFAAESFRNDNRNLLELMRFNGAVMQVCDDNLKRSGDFVLAALWNSPHDIEIQANIMKYANETVRRDRRTMVMAPRSAQKFCDDCLKRDREYCLTAVQSDGFALEWIDDTLKKDKDIVKMAVRMQPTALRWADDSLQRDRDCVLAAVRYVSGPPGRPPPALDYAHETLKRDRCFLLAAAVKDYSVLEWADECLKQDHHFWAAAAAKNSSALFD